MWSVQEMNKSNLGSLGLAQTILLLKDLWVFLKILLDHLQEERRTFTVREATNQNTWQIQHHQHVLHQCAGCCEPQIKVRIRSRSAALIRGVRKVILVCRHWLHTHSMYYVHRWNGTLICSTPSRVGGLGLQRSWQKRSLLFFWRRRPWNVHSQYALST